jgi:hypothetical protein
MYKYKQYGYFDLSFNQYHIPQICRLIVSCFNFFFYFQQYFLFLASLRIPRLDMNAPVTNYEHFYK